MAITLTVPNEFLFEEGKGANDFSSDDYKIILLAAGFTFDQDTHGTYADVSASEIDSSGGYVVGGYALTVDAAWSQDNANNRAIITWDDVTFTASAAAFDSFCAAIIYNDSHASDLIVGCIEFGQTISVADGDSFQIQDMAYSKANS